MVDTTRAVSPAANAAFDPDLRTGEFPSAKELWQLIINNLNVLEHK
jgi:hypothetical protein